jgi:hypothetical protein
MADIKSTHISNLDGEGYNPGNVSILGGRVRRKCVSIVEAAAATNDDVMRFFRIKSNANIHDFRISHGARTDSTDVNIGLHDINGGAAVDDNLFADAYSPALAADNVSLTPGDAASPLTFDKKDQMIWELLGLSVDPNKEYDVTITLVDAGTGTIETILEMLYTAGD